MTKNKTNSKDYSFNENLCNSTHLHSISQLRIFNIINDFIKETKGYKQLKVATAGKAPHKLIKNYSDHTNLFRKNTLPDIDLPPVATLHFKASVAYRKIVFRKKGDPSQILYIEL